MSGWPAAGLLVELVDFKRLGGVFTMRQSLLWLELARSSSA